MSAEEEEARRIAEMGKPILGEHSRLEVVIEESYEFKVNQGLMGFPGVDAQQWLHSCQQRSRLELCIGGLLKEAAVVDEKDATRPRTIHHYYCKPRSRLPRRPV